MVAQHKEYPTYVEHIPIIGKIIADNVPYETFLDTDYGEIHVEWVHGKVVEIQGIDEKHDDILRYFRQTFFDILRIIWWWAGIKRPHAHAY